MRDAVRFDGTQHGSASNLGITIEAAPTR